MRGVALLVLAASLAGCGMREPLRPVEGQAMPPAPAMASRAMTTDELLEPPPVARPGRVDELLRRSEEREDDRFNLPPLPSHRLMQRLQRSFEIMS